MGSLVFGLVFYLGVLAIFLVLGLLTLPYWAGLVVFWLLIALGELIGRGLKRIGLDLSGWQLPPGVDWIGILFYGGYSLVVIILGLLGTKFLIQIGILGQVWTSYIPGVILPILIQTVLFIWSQIVAKK